MWSMVRWTPGPGSQQLPTAHKYGVNKLPHSEHHFYAQDFPAALYTLLSTCGQGGQQHKLNKEFGKWPQFWAGKTACSLSDNITCTCHILSSCPQEWEGRRDAQGYHQIRLQEGVCSHWGTITSSIGLSDKTKVMWTNLAPDSSLPSAYWYLPFEQISFFIFNLFYLAACRAFL